MLHSRNFMLGSVFFALVTLLKQATAPYTTSYFYNYYYGLFSSYYYSYSTSSYVGPYATYYYNYYYGVYSSYSSSSTSSYTSLYPSYYYNAYYGLIYTYYYYSTYTSPYFNYYYGTYLDYYSLGSGIIAGIAVGSILGVAAIVGGIVLCVKCCCSAERRGRIVAVAPAGPSVSVVQSSASMMAPMGSQGGYPMSSGGMMGTNTTVATPGGTTVVNDSKAMGIPQYIQQPQPVYPPPSYQSGV